MPRLRKSKIGEITVDSGTVILSDPSYIKNNNKWMKTIINATGDSGQLPASGNATVVWSTTGGDGTFPVFQWKDENGVVKKLTIEFS